MSAFELHPAVIGLSTEVVDEIYAKYIAGDPVKSLIEGYGLTVAVSQFPRIFPPIHDGDTICRHCGQRMYCSRPPKSNYSRRHQQRFCSCGHREWRTGVSKTHLVCNCEECRKAELALREIREKERLEANTKRRNNLLKTYQFGSPITFDSLSLRELVALFALMSCRATEDLSWIRPLSDVGAGSLFAPTEDISLDLITALSKKGVVVVDAQHSSLGAFAPENARDFSPLSVCWQPNVSINGEAARCQLDTLWGWLLDCFSNGGWSEKWSAEILDLWIEIAVEESVQYLGMRINTKRSLKFSAGEKTRTELRLLLQDYSVSEIYSLCTFAVENASAFLDHKDCAGSLHASNTIPGNLRLIAERFKAKAQRPRSCHRDIRCPRSAVSRVLFGNILRLAGDVDFQFSPAGYWREELAPKYQKEAGRHGEESIVGGKHYLMCLACFSPDVNVRFNNTYQIEMVCPDCGERATYAKL